MKYKKVLCISTVVLLTTTIGIYLCKKNRRHIPRRIIKNHPYLDYEGLVRKELYFDFVDFERLPEDLLKYLSYLYENQRDQEIITNSYNILYSYDTVRKLSRMSGSNIILGRDKKENRFIYYSVNKKAYKDNKDSILKFL